MMEMGGYRERCWYSVGQEQRGFGWICLPLPPAHPRESCRGLVADLRRRGHWWLRVGLVSKGTENLAKATLGGAGI